MKLLKDISMILVFSGIIALLLVVSVILFTINEDLKNERGRLFFENRDLIQELKVAKQECK